MDYLKIKKDILEHIEKNFSSTADIEKKFREHACYSKIELEHFLPEYIALALADELDNLPLEECKHFTRRGSNMYEHNDLDRTPVADAVIYALHSSSFLKWLQAATDSQDLIPDPHLTGAGYMKSFKGDSLKVHTDFNWVEELRLHRRINCIIYLNKNWKEDWGGGLEFYDTENKKMLSKTVPKLGNLLIWSYHNLAYHGYPEPMSCPEGESRKGLRLFYYVSNSTHDPENPPHRSLYWFDDSENLPYDIKWKK